MSGSSPSPDPPRTAQGHAEVKISPETIEEEGREGDERTVSQLSPSNTPRGWRDHTERSDWNEEGSGPKGGTPIATSPMRPSKKRASSAGQESDNEPESACPDEWEKQCLVPESNREGEVRGIVEGKQVQRTRQNALALLQPSRKKNREGSGSLTLTRRVKAKAVRESPRMRKLKDKLTGRVGGGVGRRRAVIGGALGMSDACGFPGGVGASTTASVAMIQRKGSDRALLDETTGSSMPYSGDNVSFVFFFTGVII